MKTMSVLTQTFLSILYSILLSQLFLGMRLCYAASEYLDRALRLTAEGKLAYQELRFTEGEKALLSAQNLYQQEQENIGGEAYFETLIYLGMTSLALKKEDKATELFKQAAYLNLSQGLDPALFSPAVIQTFEKARQQLLSQRMSHYFVHSDPPLAEVLLNGFLKGTTPLQLRNLVAGEHYLKIQKAGFESRLEKIKVDGDKQIHWTLTPIVILKDEVPKDPIVIPQNVETSNDQERMIPQKISEGLSPFEENISEDSPWWTSKLLWFATALLAGGITYTLIENNKSQTRSDQNSEQAPIHVTFP